MSPRKPMTEFEVALFERIERSTRAIESIAKSLEKIAERMKYK